MIIYCQYYNNFNHYFSQKYFKLIPLLHHYFTQHIWEVFFPLDGFESSYRHPSTQEVNGTSLDYDISANLTFRLHYTRTSFILFLWRVRYDRTVKRSNGIMTQNCRNLPFCKWIWLSHLWPPPYWSQWISPRIETIFVLCEKISCTECEN